MDDDDHYRPWYLAQLRPNSLAMALRNLSRQSVTYFAPTEPRTERRGQQFVTRDVPAFPGYIFVQPNPHGGGIRAVNGTRGVSKIVSFGATPAIIPDDLIEALRLRFASGADRVTNTFSPGDHVQVLEGPFTEFIAQIDAVAPMERVYLLINLMGRETRVVVDAKILRRTNT